MSTQDNPKIESGMFYDRVDAERAVDQLNDLGYSGSEVSIMMNDRTRAREFAIETGTKATEGATAGGVIGGAIGALLAGLTATGSIAAVVGTGGAALPLVIGPLAAVLAGVGVGGVTGGVIGALVGAGIPEQRATEYETGLQEGGMLIALVPRDSDRKEVRQILTPDEKHERDSESRNSEREYAPTHY